MNHWAENIPAVRLDGSEANDDLIQLGRCRDFWAFVLRQAIIDALADGPEKSNQSRQQEYIREREKARRFLTTRSRDLGMVCDFVGLDPDFIIAGVKELLADPERARHALRGIHPVITNAHLPKEASL